jgi:hypothetical protein
MISKTMRRLTCVLGCMAGLLLGPNAAHAAFINPGYDLFTTIPGPFTFAILPGFGTVHFQGVPVGPGSTDTIVHRIDGIDTLPIGTSATINIELAILSLRSTAPVSLGGGVFADVYATIDTLPLLYPNLPQPDPLPRSAGTMTIRRDWEHGGTFDTSFNVFADLIFTTIGGNPNNPGDRLFSMVDSGVTLMTIGAPWLDQPVPGQDRHTAALPSGGFHGLVRSDILVLPAPSCNGYADADTVKARGHVVAPCDNPSLVNISLFVPEPSTGKLSGAALLLIALAAGCRRGLRVAGLPS